MCLIIDAALARCDREKAEAEAALRAGGKDIKGLLVWFYDWQWERKLIEKEMNTMLTRTAVSDKNLNSKDSCHCEQCSAPKSTAAKKKVAKVMGEFKEGDLKSSSGSTVTRRPQAIAIALSEARRKGK